MICVIVFKFHRKKKLEQKKNIKAINIKIIGKNQ